jgi:sigma-E factor negative regulatory protein RseC
MAQTIAIVTSTGKNRHATVVAEKGQGCGSCGTVSHCYRGQSGKTEETTALNRAGAQVGDRVSLSVQSGTILSRMAVLYLLPVAGMLVGAFIGEFMFTEPNGNKGAHSIFLGLGGFALGFVLSVAISRIWSAARPVIPVITRILNTRAVYPSPFSSPGCEGKGN